MGRVLNQRHTFAVGEKRYVRVDASENLDADETLTSPTVTNDTGLTVESVAVNTAAYTDDAGNEVAIGKAVGFFVSGGTAGTTYRPLVTVTTTDGKTLKYTAVHDWCE